MDADKERERRNAYNIEAVRQAGEFHSHRYQGLITGAELPPALAAGGRLGMIGVADEIRGMIPKERQYTPRLLVPMVNGEDVKLPGESRVYGRTKTAAPAYKPKAAATPDLNNLL